MAGPVNVEIRHPVYRPMPRACEPVAQDGYLIHRLAQTTWRPAHEVWGEGAGDDLVPALAHHPDFVEGAVSYTWAGDELAIEVKLKRAPEDLGPDLTLLWRTTGIYRGFEFGMPKRPGVIITPGTADDFGKQPEWAAPPDEAPPIVVPPIPRGSHGGDHG